MKIIRAKSRILLRTSLLFVSFFILILSYPGAVYAYQPHLKNQQAGDVVLDNVYVEIWPEYDKPSVLVIYHITLSAQVSLPAAVNIRIPAAAGKPSAVAWQSTDKALYDLKYETKPAGEWTEIQFSTPAPDVQIEYYDPGLKKTGAQRNFTFRWPGNYTVQNLSMQVQQPVNATNMKFRPDAGSGRPGALGLIYYSLLVGKVSTGKTFDLAVTYDKPDDSLTNSQQFQAAQPNQPLDSGTTGRVALDQFLPWGAGGLGLLLIAAGSIWYWKTGRITSNKAATGRARHARTRSEKPAPAAEKGDEATFCYQCGKKAAPGDAFCRACGTKLR
jgi:hypothetical protein